MAYIYQIINDINDKIYVGKTEFSIEKRFKEHCRDAFKEHSEKRPLYSAMRKYGVEHFHIELIEETDNPEEREIYWIEQLGSFKRGYNATQGGDGRRYIDYDLVLRVFRETHKIKKTADILGYDEHTVGRIVNQANEIVKTPAEIGKEYGRPVAQYSENGELLAVFENLSAAGRSIGKPRAHISQCANGQRKTAYGFIWKFIQSED